eukprot:TRINITY_DN25227_c0_g1_i1.p1 TRINITY_DN25227_c0_g1~~TRINITY_DN25227_c0_g1_i1.p1  ORF type:complete len:331 (+),score=61.01 TRINITY_DN25227_c0_g1_i1:64-1056(+)
MATQLALILTLGVQVSSSPAACQELAGECHADSRVAPRNLEDHVSLLTQSSHYSASRYVPPAGCPRPKKQHQKRLHAWRKGQNLVCRWAKKFIVTRLWNLTGNLSAEEVIDTFQEGFGVDVVAFPGFLAYVGTVTDNESEPMGKPFFFNVFDTQDGAALAQREAAEFVGDSILKGEITPILFTEGRIQFQFTADSLCSDDVALITGDYLSIRTWRITKPGATAQDVLDLFQVGFAPTIQTFPGFKMYLGAKVASDRTELAFFLNVFANPAEAREANAAAKRFAAGEGEFANTPCGGEVGKIAEVSAQTGQADFAFLAALRQHQALRPRRR